MEKLTKNDQFHKSLKVNLEKAKEIFHLPANADVVLREVDIQCLGWRPGAVIFIEGLTDKFNLLEGVLKPLVKGPETELKKAGPGKDPIIETLISRDLSGYEIQSVDNWFEAVEAINYGKTLILVEGCREALVVETKGWDRRGIEKPDNERVIVGPHESFNETLKNNTSLLRRLIRNQDLVTELIHLGKQNRTDAALLYLEGLTDPQLLERVRGRLESLSTDYIGGAGVLEQFIEDNPWMPFPQLLVTERPDRAASYLMEGKVLIILDGNPTVLAAPATFYSLLHGAEDYYLRLPYAAFTRLLRLLALFLCTFLPAIYVGLFLYHTETLPVELLLSVTASRESVPFSTVAEILFMEFAFELLRESAIRVPGTIGNTIGIVGALILGQAAVEAGIVSTVLIVVIAFTGLASFAVPNYTFSFGYRFMRFFFTILAACFGFVGIAAGLVFTFSYLAGQESFGVPFLAPVTPRIKTEPDRLFRGPVWSMDRRPAYEHPLNRRRQPRISRGWKKGRGGEEH